uniref:Uncharacterized protein n=1 Tax=Strongyloides stercoralis TaxID=6248 RepID=A0A0K0EBG7_STRER
MLLISILFIKANNDINLIVRRSLLNVDNHEESQYRVKRSKYGGKLGQKIAIKGSQAIANYLAKKIAKYQYNRNKKNSKKHKRG